MPGVDQHRPSHTSGNGQIYTLLEAVSGFCFFFIGLHLSSLRVFTICPGLRGKSPSGLSAVHLNKHSGTDEVSHGERPWAWLAATAEQQPGDAANGTTAARRHGEGAAGLLHGGSGRAPWPPPPTRGVGDEGWGSRKHECRHRVQAGVPAHAAPGGSRYSETTAGVFEKS